MHPERSLNENITILNKPDVEPDYNVITTEKRIVRIDTSSAEKIKQNNGKIFFELDETDNNKVHLIATWNETGPTGNPIQQEKEFGILDSRAVVKLKETGMLAFVKQEDGSMTLKFYEGKGENPELSARISIAAKQAEKTKQKIHSYRTLNPSEEWDNSRKTEEGLWNKKVDDAFSNFEENAKQRTKRHLGFLKTVATKFGPKSEDHFNKQTLKTIGREDLIGIAEALAKSPYQDEVSLTGSNKYLGAFEVNLEEIKDPELVGRLKSLRDEIRHNIKLGNYDPDKFRTEMLTEKERKLVESKVEIHKDKKIANERKEHNRNRARLESAEQDLAILRQELEQKSQQLQRLLVDLEAVTTALRKTDEAKKAAVEETTQVKIKIAEMREEQERKIDELRIQLQNLETMMKDLIDIKVNVDSPDTQAENPLVDKDTATPDPLDTTSLDATNKETEPQTKKTFEELKDTLKLGIANMLRASSHSKEQKMENRDKMLRMILETLEQNEIDPTPEIDREIIEIIMEVEDEVIRQTLIESLRSAAETMMADPSKSSNTVITFLDTAIGQIQKQQGIVLDINGKRIVDELIS